MHNTHQNELCPFCKTEIKNGAVVCSACGAYERTVGWDDMDRFLFLLIILGWMFFGPLLLLSAFNHSGRDARLFSYIGAAVTFLGFYVVRGIYRLFNKNGSKRVWRKRV
jgi:RNA polymerase subunit RPABC4/transcription elongation factor Spt4